MKKLKYNEFKKIIKKYDKQKNIYLKVFIVVFLFLILIINVNI